MQVSFAHNYSKIFFKGDSPSSETEAALDKQPLTDKELRDKQTQHSQATTKALQAFAGISQTSATPPIVDIAFKGGSEEVTAKALNDQNLTYNQAPGPKVETAGHGVYNGSDPNKISYKDMCESLKLIEGDIVKTIKDGNKTTYMMRDGSVVEVNEETGATAIDYSNCSGRDENDPIKKIYKGYSDKKLTEIHWENGAFNYFDNYGKLSLAIRKKSDGCEICFGRDPRGKLKVTFETFPSKTEGENTQYSEHSPIHPNSVVYHVSSILLEGKNTQYPEYFAIEPDSVEYHANGYLKTISPDYKKGSSYRFTKIDSWDEATNKIQSYSCPLSSIEFYPSGQIKSEHYTFELNGWRRNFVIKFNENGQVDDIIISGAVEKETSSQIKEKLIKAGYEGYAKYASDLKERAAIAYSVLKRPEEVTVKAQEDIVKTIENGDTITHTRRDGSIVTVEEGLYKTITFDYSKCTNRGENDPIKEIIRNQDTPEETFERRWENGAYEYFDKYGKLIETTIIKNNDCGVTFRRVPSGAFEVVFEKFPPKPEGENTPPTEYFAIDPGCTIYDKNDILEAIITNYRKGLNPSRGYTKIRSWNEVANKIQSYSYPVSIIGFYPSGQIKSELYEFLFKGNNYPLKIKFNKNGQVCDVISANIYREINEKTLSQIKEELIKAGYKGYTEYASDLKERAEIAHSVLERSKETPQ